MRRNPPPLPRYRYSVHIKVWNGKRYDVHIYGVTTTSEAAARLGAMMQHAIKTGMDVTPAHIEHVELIGRTSR